MAGKSKSKSAALRNHQVAALAYRGDGRSGIEILIITSRETGRFIIPKGWPVKGLSDPDAAAKEAFEEAGVDGRVRRRPIGRYRYWKRLTDSFELVNVDVYPLEVRTQKKKWPEQGERQMAWLAPADAALLVDEPELATIIREFAPERLP